MGHWATSLLCTVVGLRCSLLGITGGRCGLERRLTVGSDRPGVQLHLCHLPAADGRERALGKPLTSIKD